MSQPFYHFRSGLAAVRTNENESDSNNLNSAVATECGGRSVRNPQRLKDRNVSRDPKPTTQPVRVKRRN